MTRHIILRFDDKKFEKLKKRKDNDKEKLNWEDFVFKTICGK